MCHFYGLSEAQPLGHSHYTKPRKSHDPQKLWNRFKKFALSLGFVLPGHNLSRSTHHLPEFTAVHIFLTRLHPPGLFEYNPSILAECSSYVANVLSQIKKHRVEAPVPFLSLDIEDNWSLQKQCGMTDIETFFSDQKYLFFHNVYCFSNDSQQHSLTSFTVKRDMFLAFFSDFCKDTDMTGTDSSSHADYRDQAGAVSAQVEISSTSQATLVQDTNMILKGEEMNMFDSSLTTAMVPATLQSQTSSDLATQQLLQPQPHLLSIDPYILESDNPPIGPELRLAQEHDRSLLQGDSNKLILQSLLSPTEHGISPIKWQTIDACACHISITPSLFYAQLCGQAPESPPYTIFYNVSEKEIICLLHSSMNRFPDLLCEMGDVWFARVDEGLEKLLMLNSLTVKQVMSILQQSTGILFVGKAGDFRSDILLSNIHTAVVETIAMPHFHEDQNLWEVKSQEMIL